MACGKKDENKQAGGKIGQEKAKFEKIEQKKNKSKRSVILNLPHLLSKKGEAPISELSSIKKPGERVGRNKPKGLVGRKAGENILTTTALA